MIKISQAIVVEGKYDKICLENIVDATIIVTNGFRIFKDTEKRELLRTLAEKIGLVVVTDSDSAGSMIRSHLKQICPTGTITNVYVPQLMGKEKRKAKPSKEGLIGVEGLDKQTILAAFEKSGIIGDEVAVKQGHKITKTDLFEIGLSGSQNSSFLRMSLAKHLNLPTSMSANAFLDCINAIYNYDEFMEAVKTWQQDEDKR